MICNIFQVMEKILAAGTLVFGAEDPDVQSYLELIQEMHSIDNTMTKLTEQGSRLNALTLTELLVMKRDSTLLKERANAAMDKIKNHPLVGRLEACDSCAVSTGGVLN